MATAKVEVRDRGWKAIRQQFLKTKPRLELTVGVQGTDASQDHDGITNAALAAIHEFGAPAAGIPERSFLRSTISRENKKYLKLLQNAGKNALAKVPAKKSLEILGEIVVADVRKTIDRSIGLKPLKAATVARKGSSKPLIDTGQLKGSITAVVK